MSSLISGNEPEQESEFHKIAFDKEENGDNEHWLKTTFQLATIGGIAAGAAALPYTGTAKSTALKALKTSDDALARYMKRNKTPQMKIVIDAVRKTPKKMAAYSKQMRNQSQYVSNALEPIDKIDSNLVKRKVESEFIARNNSEKIYAEEQGRKPNFITRDTIKKDLFAQHENARLLGMGSSPFRENAVGGQQVVNNGRDTKMNTLTTNAIAGIGLGAGITAYHAIDDRVTGGGHDKKDKTFRAGGSWLGQEKKAGAGDMAKSLLAKASGRVNQVGGDMHRAMGSKGAEALQSALIFNAAGLGFAKALETSRTKARTEAEKKEKPANGRIIIDLPSQQTQDEIHNMNQSNPMGAPGGGFQQYAGEEKTASLGAAAQRFGKNLLGRGEETQALKHNISGGMDLYKAKLLGQGLEGDQLNAAAAKALSSDQLALHQLQNEVGGSRLKAGAGLLGAGLLGSTLKNHMDKDEQIQQ